MFPFWALQPVFHVYDLHYYFSKPGVIQDTISSKKKYVNYTNIVPVYNNEENQSYKKQMVELLNSHYLRNKDLEYLPKDQHIEPYLDTRDIIILHYFYADRIIGTVTLRSINCELDGISPPLQYVDFLCVHKDHRKKGIAQELIATLYDYQRRESYYKVSLFKNEGQQRGIIPLCMYRSYRISLTEYVPFKLSPQYKLLNVTEKDFYKLYGLMKDIRHDFPCYISMDVCHMMVLLNTKNIEIYTLSYKDNILALYFVRNAQCFHNGKTVNELYCTYKSRQCNKETFITGFHYLLTLLQKTSDELIIEDIGHTEWLVNWAIKIRTPLKISSYITGYYLYNYIHKTLPPSKLYINL